MLRVGNMEEGQTTYKYMEMYIEHMEIHGESPSGWQSPIVFACESLYTCNYSHNYTPHFLFINFRIPIK